LTPARRQPEKRNGRLRIPLPLEEALKAATETKPSEKKPKEKRRAKKS
jgi:hypothetical protein